MRRSGVLVGLVSRVTCGSRGLTSGASTTFVRSLARCTRRSCRGQCRSLIRSETSRELFGWRGFALGRRFLFGARHKMKFFEAQFPEHDPERDK